MRARPGPIGGLFHCIASPQDAFYKFISCNIVEKVLHCTNLEGRRVAAQHNKTWRAVDKDELLAFIGLVLLAGVEKSWDVPALEQFCDLTQNPMYKAAISIGRFEDIRRYFRFDDKRTRHSRLETDHMAAFTNVWKLFLDNCKTNFIPSECVTMDEQLVPFQGRCKFLQYMPSKPAKYGIKIWWMCDSLVPYAVDGDVYFGRQPGESRQQNLGKATILNLSRGISKTGEC